MDNYQSMRHFMSLCAVFLVGNSVIAFPLVKDKNDNLAAFLLSFAASITIIFCISKIPQNIICKIENSCENRWWAIMLSLALKALFLIFILMCAIDTCTQFVYFVSKNIMPEASSPILLASFLLLVIYLSLNNPKVLLNFSLISFFSVCFAVFSLFIMSLPQMEIGNIALDVDFDISRIFKNSFLFFAKSFGQTIIVFYFLYNISSHTARSSALAGVVCGGLLITLSLLNSFLIFGEQLSAILEFPYASAVSIISFGSLFNRMEGISYIIYFLCCLIKASVCVHSLKLLLNRAFGGSQYALVWFCGAVIFAFCLLFK